MTRLFCFSLNSYAANIFSLREMERQFLLIETLWLSEECFVVEWILIAVHKVSQGTFICLLLSFPGSLSRSRRREEEKGPWVKGCYFAYIKEARICFCFLGLERICLLKSKFCVEDQTSISFILHHVSLWARLGYELQARFTFLLLCKQQPLINITVTHSPSF